MKYLGFLVVLLGLWLVSAAWSDPVEGKLLRPAGIILALGGLFLMLEGFKREIISALRQSPRSTE